MKPAIQSRSRVWLGMRASKPAFVAKILLIKLEDEKESTLKRRDEKILLEKFI
jgi:hypothetical protein